MKKIIAILLLLSLSYPLCSQSLSGLISDLEEVSQIISESENNIENIKQQLQDLKLNNLQTEKQLEDSEISIERQRELLATLSEQWKQLEQTYQQQTKSYDKLSFRFKALSYFTVGIGVAGVTGWILWAIKP